MQINQQRWSEHIYFPFSYLSVFLMHLSLIYLYLNVFLTFLFIFKTIIFFLPPSPFNFSIYFDFEGKWATWSERPCILIACKH